MTPHYYKLPLELAERRLDPLRQNGVHDEILEEETLARVAIPLEHVEVAIVRNLAADRANLLRVEELGGRALELLALEVV